MKLALVVVMACLVPGRADATTDQMCWTHVAGFDEQTKTVWSQTDCAFEEKPCTTGFAKLVLDTKQTGFTDASTRVVKKDEQCVVLKDAADVESFKRARPLIELAPQELAFQLEKPHKGDELEPHWGKLVGRHAEGTRIKMKLARAPRIASAYLIPNTTRGIAEIRFASMFGCCPIDGGQRFELFDYKPASIVTPAQVELHAGPQYLAVTEGKQRFQADVPCTPVGTPIVLPFEMTCKGSKDRVVVEREGDTIRARRGAIELARLHVAAATVVGVRVERELANSWDSNNYVTTRLLCTSDGRCATVADGYLVDALPHTSKKRCKDDACVMVPTSRKAKKAFRFEPGGGTIEVIDWP